MRVGDEVMQRAHCVRERVDIRPRAATWICAAVARFDPAADEVELESGDPIHYRYLR